MFKRGKKAAASSQRGPLRYLGLAATARYGQKIMGDVRGLEGLAYPVMGLVALWTYRREQRRRERAALDDERNDVREGLYQARRLRPAARRKWFDLF